METEKTRVYAAVRDVLTRLLAKIERLESKTTDRTIVCLCGSTRFKEEIMAANRTQTGWGKIVLAPGIFGHSGDPLTDDVKARLDELHLRKIDMADEVLVVNVGGYIGESTRREITYAVKLGKPVMYTEAA